MLGWLLKLAEVWTVTELTRTLRLKPVTVKRKISQKEFGSVKKVGADVWSFEDGAIERYRLAKYDEASNKSKAKREKSKDTAEYVYIPSYTPAEAEKLAEEFLLKYKKDHLNDLDKLEPEEASKRITAYFKMQYGRLIALKKKVKVSDIGEAEMRVAYSSPIFIADHINRMRDADASYFIQEWSRYIETYDADGSPVINFLLIQLLDEQITVRRLQSVMSLHEMSAPESVNKNLTASLKRYSDILKQLDRIVSPTTGDEEEEALFSAGSEDDIK